MSNWQDEFLAEYRRQQILEEVEQARLEELARKSRAQRPRLSERILFRVASWMISAGRQLHKHYEISQEEKWIDPRTKAIS